MRTFLAMAANPIIAVSHLMPRAGLTTPSTQGAISNPQLSELHTSASQPSFQSVLDSATSAIPSRDQTPQKPARDNTKGTDCGSQAQDDQKKLLQAAKHQAELQLLAAIQLPVPNPSPNAGSGAASVNNTQDSPSTNANSGSTPLAAIAISGTQDPSVAGSDQKSSPATRQPSAIDSPALNSVELKRLAETLAAGATATTNSSASPPPQASKPQETASQVKQTDAHSISQAAPIPSKADGASPPAQPALSVAQAVKNQNINSQVTQAMSDLKISGPDSTLLAPSAKPEKPQAHPSAQPATSANSQKDSAPSTPPKPASGTAADNIHSANSGTGHAMADDSHKQADTSSKGPASGGAGPLASNSHSDGTAASTAFAASLADHTDASGNAASPQPNTPAAASSHTPANANSLAGWDAVSGQAGRVINSATFSQARDQIEMKVAIHTDALGSLELHTVLKGDRLGAAINVQNPETHLLLASELPALHQALSNQNLRLDQVSILNNFTHGGHPGAQGGSGSRPGNSPYHSGPSWQPGSPQGDIEPGLTPELEVFESETRVGRLSVRA
jgi:hypothetical protein